MEMPVKINLKAYRVCTCNILYGGHIEKLSHGNRTFTELYILHAKKHYIKSLMLLPRKDNRTIVVLSTSYK